LLFVTYTLQMSCFAGLLLTQLTSSIYCNRSRGWWC